VLFATSEAAAAISVIAVATCPVWAFSSSTEWVLCLDASDHGLQAVFHHAQRELEFSQIVAASGQHPLRQRIGVDTTGMADQAPKRPGHQSHHHARRQQAGTRRRQHG
jgi:hypothetical protein